MPIDLEAPGQKSGMLSSASPEGARGDWQFSWLQFFLLNHPTQAWTLWPVTQPASWGAHSPTPAWPMFP